MPKRTVRSHKRGGRRRHRTRSGKKTGGAPRLAGTVGLLEDVEEKLRAIIQEADKIEEINDQVGDQQLDALPEETRRAISNAYNTVVDVVQDIKEACDKGVAATRPAVRASVATYQ
jgi:hypothetical protein